MFPIKSSFNAFFLFSAKLVRTGSPTVTQVYSNYSKVDLPVNFLTLLLGPGSIGLLFRFPIFFVEILEETENDETEKKAKEL